MELVRELLITVGISLLVSYVLAKLFSMASPSPSTTIPNNTVSSSSSSSPSPKESVFIAKTPDQKPPRVGLADQAVELNQLEENPLPMAQTIGSTSICDDDEVIDNEVVLNRQDPGASSAVGWENRIISEGSSSILTESVKVGGVELEDRVFDGIAETTGFHEIEIESGKHEVNVGAGEGNQGDESDDGAAGNENCEGGGEGAFGDWEGVERTELEKRFGDAVAFVGSKSNADQTSRLDSDVKMQLYGLHKVAIDGKCSVPSPMALKVSARAKWNAWQQLGDMSREVAMEQYLSLLSSSIPGWTGYDAKGFSDEKSAPVPTVNVHNRHVTENESSLIELKPGDEGCGMTGSIQTP